MKSRQKTKQLIIEKIECITFISTKLCIFILACFKNTIDCIIIDIPLKDNKPEHKQIESGETQTDNSFAPLVTSKMPYKTPLSKELFKPNF